MSSNSDSKNTCGNLSTKNLSVATQKSVTFVSVFRDSLTVSILNFALTILTTWWYPNILSKIDFSQRQTYLLFEPFPAKMKLFQFLRKFCELMGILPVPANRNHAFNWKVLLILLFLCNNFISSIIFLSRNEKSMLEIGDSFFMCISNIVGIALLLITIWKMPITLRMITEFQEIIEKSK